MKLANSSLKINQSGFTIIELLLIIGIMSIVGTMSVSFYGRFLTQNGVANTVDQLVNTVRKAQIYSMESRKSSTVGWGVNYSSNTITMFQGATYAGRNVVLDEKFSVSPAITISGLTEIDFARLTGTPNVAPTITVSGSGISKVITVYSTGAISK